MERFERPQRPRSDEGELIFCYNAVIETNFCFTAHFSILSED